MTGMMSDLERENGGDDRWLQESQRLFTERPFGKESPSGSIIKIRLGAALFYTRQLP
jgi:hypothetical protein